MRRMSREHRLGWIAAALVFAVVAGVWWRRVAPPAPAPAPGVAPIAAAPVPAGTQPRAEVVPATAPIASPPSVAEATPPAHPHADEVNAPVADAHMHAEPALAAGPPPPAVEIAATEVLASVNGMAITLADLVPVRAGEAKQTLSTRDYGLLLNAAIERQVVAQAARAEGIVLTPAQEANVDGVRRQHHADIEANRQQGLTWTSVTDAQIEFEADRAAAILLKQNVLAEAGAPPLQPPYAAVEAHYQANPARYAPLPEEPAAREAAWQEIYMQIRQELDPLYLDAYLAWEKQYLDGLKSNANVVVVRPPA